MEFTYGTRESGADAVVASRESGFTEEPRSPASTAPLQGRAETALEAAIDALSAALVVTRSPSDRRRVVLDLSAGEDALAITLRWRSRQRRGSTVGWAWLSPKGGEAVAGMAPLVEATRFCRCAARLHGETRIWETVSGRSATPPAWDAHDAFGRFEHFAHIECALIGAPRLTAASLRQAARRFDASRAVATFRVDGVRLEPESLSA